jgi:hypothetical protein
VAKQKYNSQRRKPTPKLKQTRLSEKATALGQQPSAISALQKKQLYYSSFTEQGTTHPNQPKTTAN